MTLRSLNDSVPYEETTITQNGDYVFHAVPTAVQFELQAYKTGYAPRRQLILLKGGVLDRQTRILPSANRFDFGAADPHQALNSALSERPEVIKVTPGDTNRTTNIDPKTSFTLTFSEPMEPRSVEDSFSIRAYTSTTLSADQASSQPTFTGSGTLEQLSGSPIWDKDAFHIFWNSDETEVTFSFTKEHLLPTDKEARHLPMYQLAFDSLNGQGRSIRDKQGHSRDSLHFKLNEGPFHESVAFAIKPDQNAPELRQYQAHSAENGSPYGDHIWLRFSERMIIFPLVKAIAGGMDGRVSLAPAAYPGPAGEASDAVSAAQNYTLTLQTTDTLIYKGTWGDLGGQAVYDSEDFTHKTIRLLPGIASSTVQSASLAGQELKLAVVLSNGSQEQVSLNLSGNTYQSLQDELNNLFDGQPLQLHAENAYGQPVNITDTLKSGDRFVCNLATNARRLPDGPLVRHLRWLQSPAQQALGLTANRVLLTGERSRLGAPPDLFQPGDHLSLTPSALIIDPAGNTLQSRTVGMTVN